MAVKKKAVETQPEIPEKPARKPRKARVNPETELKAAYGKRKRLTRSDAIKKYCIECHNYMPKEVRGCPAEHCALWPFRLGTEIPTDVPMLG